MEASLIAKVLPYAQVAAALVAIAMALVIGPVVKMLRRIRKNDLHHLDMKVDGVSDQVKALHAAVDKLGEKFDRHIEWHLEHPQPK